MVGAGRGRAKTHLSFFFFSFFCRFSVALDDVGVPEQLDTFFQDVNTVKEKMVVLKDNVGRINNLTRARLVEVDNSKEERRGDELQEIVDQSNAAISIISKKLKGAWRETASFFPFLGLLIRIFP